MGLQFGDPAGLRPEVWRVIPSGVAGSGDADQRPVRICHVLQVGVPGGPGVAAVADAQRGMVHHTQLVALGLSRRVIAGRRARGALHPVLPQVDAVGHAGLQPLARETAALLFCGRDAVLSHGTAAALWGIVPQLPPEVALTVADRNVRTPAGLIVHRVELLDARDVAFREGLPVTNLARTMIDLAGIASDGTLAAGLGEARLSHRVTDAALEAAMQRCPHRTGVGALHDLLARERGSSPTRSEAERRLRRLVDAGQLPAPQFNAWLEGYLVDAFWPEHRLVVEVDGYSVHARRPTFENDRRRDQRLAAAGYIVLRITRRQLKEQPMAVLASLAQALGVAQERLARG